MSKTSKKLLKLLQKAVLLSYNDYTINTRVATKTIVNIHAQTVPSNKDGVVQNLLLLNYCIEGRCEFKMDEYNYSYLEHHRMNIALQVPQDNFYYPSGRYKGYEIYLFPQMLTKETTEFLKALGIKIENLIDNYTKYRVFYTPEIVEKPRRGRTRIDGMHLGCRPAHAVQCHAVVGFLLGLIVL